MEKRKEGSLMVTFKLALTSGTRKGPVVPTIRLRPSLLWQSRDFAEILKYIQIITVADLGVVKDVAGSSRPKFTLFTDNYGVLCFLKEKTAYWRKKYT